MLKHKEMLVIYLENAELKYGLGLQLNALQSLYRFRHTTEKSFLDELMKARILQDCKRNGASFEEVRRMSAKNGKRRAVLKTVLIVDEKQRDSVVVENEKRDSESVSLEKRKAEEAARIAEEKRRAEEAARIADAKHKIGRNHKYNEAVSLMENGKYAEAIAVFETLRGYKDSSEKITVCKSEKFLSEKYYEAAVLLEQKNYTGAYEAFSGLGNYRDSVEKTKKAKDLIKKSAFSEKFQMGNTVKFGSYPQENNEKEAIEWQVLDVRSGKALLISKYALDC